MSEDRVSVQVLQEAADLQKKKSTDYQNPNSTVVQADYYPNGVQTIQDIIWAKVLRARSLLESGNAPNNESLEDTYIDLINYASFAVAWIRGGVPGQLYNRDIFNKVKPAGTANLSAQTITGLAEALSGTIQTTFWPNATFTQTAVDGAKPTLPTGE